MAQTPGENAPRHRYEGPREIDSPGACLYIRFAGRMGDGEVTESRIFHTKHLLCYIACMCGV